MFLLNLKYIVVPTLWLGKQLFKCKLLLLIYGSTADDFIFYILHNNSNYTEWMTSDQSLNLVSFCQQM